MKYAIVGMGARSVMYQEALRGAYGEFGALVAYCDVNRGRLERAQRYDQSKGASAAAYDAADFDRMIDETRPDTVIVTTTDAFHHEYIVRAMRLGCDVVTEKPMTIGAAPCQEIIDTQRATGRRCTVTFNYRYSPPRSQVKDLLMKGAVGDVLSVDFHWMLNTHHGADYFRRWHSRKAISGGLIVHKATHHFDLVNWWLSAVPDRVYASGKREFYTPATARRIGLSGPHERCATCPEGDRCGFRLDLSANDELRELYLDAERYDGYFRDRCVFRDDIDIEDTIGAVVEYDNGASMSYSLNAFSAWEGYSVVFNGTLGRLEHTVVEQVYVSGTGETQGGIEEGGVTTRVIPLRGAPRDIAPWTGEGDHGGGDEIMLDWLFRPGKGEDPYMRAADQRAGSYSILTGVAANRSMATGAPVRIEALVRGIGYPDYPAGCARRVGNGAERT